jgi:hypothetical protein
MSQSSIPAMTEYVLVQPKTLLVDSVTPAMIESLQREVILQAQGEAVELFADRSSLTVALAFATVYDIADEVILRLSSDQLVLLFDHQPKDTVRPNQVNEALWAEILKIKKKSIFVQDILAPKTEVTIDLSALWSQVRKHDDPIAHTKLFIKALTEVLEPAVTVRLLGEIPNLPLLSTIYLVRPYGHKIIFEDNQSLTVTLFSNF